MLSAAQKVIVFTDSSKFGKKSFARICDLSQVDEIITDNGISNSIRKKLEEKEIKVTIVN